MSKKSRRRPEPKTQKLIELSLKFFQGPADVALRKLALEGKALGPEVKRQFAQYRRQHVYNAFAGLTAATLRSTGAMVMGGSVLGSIFIARQVEKSLDIRGKIDKIIGKDIKDGSIILEMLALDQEHIEIPVGDLGVIPFGNSFLVMELFNVRDLI